MSAATNNQQTYSASSTRELHYCGTISPYVLGTLEDTWPSALRELASRFSRSYQSRSGQAILGTPLVCRKLPPAVSVAGQDIDQRIEAVLLTVLPQTQEDRQNAAVLSPEAEFVWSKALFRALNAATVFSEETHADY